MVPDPRCSRSLPLTILIGFLTNPSLPGLEARFETSRGNFVVTLNVEDAPLAVTRFVQLAEGSSPWLATGTGALRNDSFFAGQQVTATVSDGTDEYFAVGNPGGQSDTGFLIPDELGQSSGHQPYTLALSNDGPNRNGGTYYLTGNLAMPHRDGSNTVLGYVSGEAGKTVVDAIITAGSGATTIHSIEIADISGATELLAAAAGNLPVLASPRARLSLPSSGETVLAFAQETPAVLWVATGDDLETWNPAFGTFHQTPGSGQGEFLLDNSGAPATSFFRLSVARYPAASGSLGPDQLADKTIAVDSPQVGTLLYHFDGTGMAGTFENILFPGEPPLFSGPFTVTGAIDASPYATAFSVETSGLGNARYQVIHAGWDQGSGTGATGRCDIELRNTSNAFILKDRGFCTLEIP